MAKANRAKRADKAPHSVNEATYERQCQAAADHRSAGATGGDGSSVVEIVTVDSRTGQRSIAKPRQFRTTRVDHLYHLGALNFGQWYAADWWRRQVENGFGNARVCGDYGQSQGGGTRDPSPIPTTARAEAARAELRKAKDAISLDQRMAIEDALDDPHPTVVGAAATARCNRWRWGLKALAVYLRVA